MDWKNRFLFAAAKDFPLGEKWLQREAEAHLHPVLNVRMLGALPAFLLSAYIAQYRGSFTFTRLRVSVAHMYYNNCYN